MTLFQHVLPGEGRINLGQSLFPISGVSKLLPGPALVNGFPEIQPCQLKYALAAFTYRAGLISNDKDHTAPKSKILAT